MKLKENKNKKEGRKTFNIQIAAEFGSASESRNSPRTRASTIASDSPKTKRKRQEREKGRGEEIVSSLFSSSCRSLAFDCRLETTGGGGGRLHGILPHSLLEQGTCFSFCLTGIFVLGEAAICSDHFPQELSPGIHVPRLCGLCCPWARQRRSGGRLTALRPH